MDFKIVQLCFILLHILVSSQDLEISSSSNEGVVNIEIKNNTDKEVIFYFDQSDIRFDCPNVTLIYDHNQIIDQNFLTPNICVEKKENWFIPDIIKIIHGAPRYGKDLDLNLSQYLEYCKLILKPLEKKTFTFNINELEIYQDLRGRLKVFPLKAKVVLYHIEIVEDRIIHKSTLVSNEFMMNVKMMKE